MATNPKRPYCPNCHRELVFAALAIGKSVFSAWLCDCDPQPKEIKADIVRAREWDDQAMIYEIELENDQSS